MLTQCGHCRAVFRVRAAHLVVARGHVECGACGQVFYALDRLGDEPAVAALGTAPPVAPIVEAPITIAPRDTAEPALAGPALLDPQPAPDVDASGQRKRRRAAVRAERRWGGIARILLFAFAAQVAWAARESIWPRFPVLVAPLRAQCEQWNCAALLRLPSPRVAVLDESLRAHPARADALLWNATLQSAESHPVPLPSLELRLERADGTPVAVRRFAPRDYLADAALGPNLLPGARAFAVLELRRPSAAERYRVLVR